MGVDLARNKKKLIYSRGFLFAIMSINSIILQTFSEAKADFMSEQCPTGLALRAYCALFQHVLCRSWQLVLDHQEGEFICGCDMHKENSFAVNEDEKA